MANPISPKICSGPRRIVQEKLDRQQIENHANRAGDAVLRFAMLPRAMIDDALGDRDALLAGDRRQKAVHLAIQLQRLDDFRSKRLERTAVVVQVDAGRHRNQPVRHHRRHPA